MSRQKFWLIYILLVLAQIAICNFFNFTPLVSLSILPALVMCIPPSVSTPWTMVIAFFTGLVTDFSCDTVLGINALSLVPVALCRNMLLRMILGVDMHDRPETLSFTNKGFSKVSGIVLIAVSVFYFIYTIVDGAGMRSFLFDLLHFASSVAVSYLMSLAVVAAYSNRKKHGS